MWLLWPTRDRGLPHPGAGVRGPSPFHTPRQSERGAPVLWNLWGVWALGHPLQWRRDILMEPPAAPGSSDALACRRRNTSIVCADFRRTHVIFDPINKSKKIFWASINHPFSFPLEFKIINSRWIFTSNFVVLIFKSSNKTLHQMPLHLLSRGKSPRTIPTLTIPYLSNFKLCCYFSYLH